eukprot:scaffold13714_cov221-Alexandrium_tamarense.AAC.1
MLLFLRDVHYDRMEMRGGNKKKTKFELHTFQRQGSLPTIPIQAIHKSHTHPRSTRTQAFWTPHRNTHQTTTSTTESIQTPPPVTNISTKATLQPNLLPPPPTTKRMQRMKHSRIVPNRIHQHVVKVDGGDGVTYGEGGGGVTTAEDGCEGCGCFGWLEVLRVDVGAVIREIRNKAALHVIPLRKQYQRRP